MDLFSESAQEGGQPLAARMRPRTLSEYIGQDHIIGPGRLLRRAIQADQISSLLFYGPPGTGKTTLARVIANTTKSHFATLNAVLSGVKELREIIAAARERRDLYDRRTILFIDEVHRWNKSQQDALLPWVENGTVILIGATTENPFFEVNKALVSRSRVFQLKPLGKQDLMAIAGQALEDPVRGFGKIQVSWEKGALEHLIDVANGDARSLLNALELALTTTPAEKGESSPGLHISLEIAEQSIQEKAVLYDKEGDYHFDVISAFIKSIRGSDPDAVTYWLARMLQAGESPRFIFRRMLISACEDIGLADPRAIMVVEADAAAFDRIGLPEGRFHLTHAALYLATAPKSNSCMAIFDAIETVAREQQGEVPNHLRDANRDGAAFGHGEGYLYPHAYREHWVAQQYLPTGLQGKTFYNPAATGYEAEIREDVLRRREIQLASVHPEDSAEVLSFSPPEQETEQWLQRINNCRNRQLQTIRGVIFELVDIKRHYRVLDLNAGGGLLLWETVRRTPEGGVTGLVSQPERLDVLEHYAAELPELNRPHLLCGNPESMLTETRTWMEEGLLFDVVMAHHLFHRSDNRLQFFETIFRMQAPGGQLVLAVILPHRSTRLTDLLAEEKIDEKNFMYLRQAEAALYGDTENSLLNWDSKQLLFQLEKAGYRQITHIFREFHEDRLLRKTDILRWLNPVHGTWNYGTKLKEELPEQTIRDLEEKVLQKLDNRTVKWKREWIFIHAVKSAQARP